MLSTTLLRRAALATSKFSTTRAPPRITKASTPSLYLTTTSTPASIPLTHSATHRPPQPIRAHPEPRHSLHTVCSACLPPACTRRSLSTRRKEVALPSAVQKASGRDLVLSPPALVITRDYEWANIIIGFEQANKYTIRAAPGGQVVGYLAEESSIGSTITRNILRTRRPFKATVFDKDGEIIFTMRRPLFLISSSIIIETVEHQQLGEVHMHWHLWRRRYNLYADKAQFASVDSGFLAVDFDMRDIHGKKIASVNKDFTGFAREIFTDARQYVLRLDPSFGLQSDGMLVSDAATVDLASEPLSDVELGHRERAIIMATAISIDFDYFSVHSRGHMSPGMMMMPGMGGGSAPPAGGAGMGGAGGAGAAGAAVGGDVLSDAANAQGDEVADDPYDTPLNDGEGQEGGQGDWATFEEPDHGFSEESGDDSWGEGAADGGSEGGGGLFDVMKDIFGVGDS